jgi:hypothetical protein
VGLIGDIEKAFLMISVNPPDRDVFRFLWVDDIKREIPTIVTLRFKQVTFGVSSSPFLLNGTIKYHIEQYQSEDPEFVSKFLRSIYVDDLIIGSSSVQKAFELYSKAKHRLAEGGLNLRHFMSNSPQLTALIEEAECNIVSDHCEQITEEDQTYSKSTLGDEIVLKEEQKVLGVHWNYKRDYLVFDIQYITEVSASERPTKRGIVSVAARFYDPLGVLSPCIVLFKLLLQRVWEAGLDWDELLTPELQATWQQLLTELTRAPVISIPRCYFSTHQLLLIAA